MQRSPGTYTQGTIYGQVGTNQLVGAGTSWMVTDSSGAQVSNIAAYDELAMPGRPSVRIRSVEDDQHITLDEPLPFGIPAGSAYVIIRRTVSPTTATLGELQRLAKRGTDGSPITYETFDNGVSRMRLGFADDGRIQIKVGATKADGTAQNPWHSALLIDPATGTVSATGLAGGQQTSTFATIYSVVGTLPGSLGKDGDYNFDMVNGVFTGPKNGGAWPTGYDLEAATDAAAASAAAAVVSASAAAASASSAGSAATSAVASKANKGENSDITSLSGLTTALSIAQGGTGAKTIADALAGLQAVQQGGGIGQTPNKLFLGWSNSGLKATVDNVDLGRVWTDYASGKSLALSGYQILPSGLIVQWGSVALNTDQYGVATISFPTSYPTASLRTLVMNGDQAVAPLLFGLLTGGSQAPTKQQFAVRAWNAQSAAYHMNSAVRIDFIGVGY